jgi:hypothetical protein
MLRRIAKGLIMLDADMYRAMVVVETARKGWYMRWEAMLNKLHILTLSVDRGVL